MNNLQAGILASVSGALLLLVLEVNANLYITSDLTLDNVREAAGYYTKCVNTAKINYENWENFKDGRTYAQIAADINAASQNREVTLDEDLIEGVDDVYRTGYEVYQYSAGEGVMAEFDRLHNSWADFYF